MNPILITGCHRSGTSLLASMVSSATGEQRDNDLPALIDNPTGYFESHSLRDLNDQLLSGLGYSWDQPPLHPLLWRTGPRMQSLLQARQSYGSRRCSEEAWVDKDPRLCITFGAFEHILLTRAALGVSLRAPMDVATSLHRRDGLSIKHGLLIWYLYNRQISLHLIASDLLVIYEELIQANATGAATASLQLLESWLQEQIGKHLLGGSSEHSLSQRLSEKVRPNLQRSISSQSIEKECSPNPESSNRESDTHGQLEIICQDIYSNIAMAPTGKRIYQLKECFKDVPAYIIDNYEAILLTQEPGLEFIRRSQANSSQKAELEQIRSSTSWKITAPLRWLGDRLREKSPAKI